MIATLRFNLDNPWEVKEHRRCLRSFDVLSALDEIGQELRRITKHEELTDDAREHHARLASFFHTVLAERNINFDELWS